MVAIEYEIGELLRSKGLTLGAVESATGGLISHLITNVPGSSDYFKGSVTSYANETKINVIGVKAATLKKYGAVSYQVAEQMAAGGRKLLNVDICVADTGIAGPGGATPAGATPAKAVGLFYLGLAAKDGVSNRKHEFHSTREENKRDAAITALEWVKEYLLSL
jgi:nicotinamide-nucleotide amidase